MPQYISGYSDIFTSSKWRVGNIASIAGVSQRATPCAVITTIVGVSIELMTSGLLFILKIIGVVHEVFGID